MAAPKKLSAGQIINQLRKAGVGLANGKRVKQVCRELGLHDLPFLPFRRVWFRRAQMAGKQGQIAGIVYTLPRPPQHMDRRFPRLQE